jgi:hypothetical protein
MKGSTGADLPPIYFYLPKRDWPQSLPSSPDEYWAGFGKGLTSGVYAWTLQTFLQLKRAEIDCELVSEFPDEGIVLGHRRSLPSVFRPPARLLLVCLKADYDWHPYAQIHVVLNPKETKTHRKTFYMPHWPQPGLVPRDLARGDRFENIAYIGAIENLAPELRDASWEKQVAGMGMKWLLPAQDRWNDFSNIDAIVAVRSFDGKVYGWKPATKLYNAWHAGVPAILGREAAYEAERKSELDYLDAESPQDVIASLKRMAKDKQFRAAMVENGCVRARETEPSKLVARWVELLTDVAVPELQRWRETSEFARQAFLRYRSVASNLRRLKLRVRELVMPA